MTDRMIRIPFNVSPILVDSAFGGLCIHRRWIFDQFDYSDDATEYAYENEHVTLHRKVRSSAGNIYIHPGLINANWTTHSLRGMPTINLLISIAQVFPFRFALPVLRKALLYVAKYF
jgi:hypothetical protein